MDTQALPPAPRPAPPPLGDQEIEAILKALANPLRREILQWLRDPARHFPPQPGYPLEEGVCVSRIYEKAALAQSTVSSYLAMLQRAGLLTSRRVGQWTFYRRDEAMILRFVVSLGPALSCPLHESREHEPRGG